MLLDCKFPLTCGNFLFPACRQWLYILHGPSQLENSQIQGNFTSMGFPTLKIKGLKAVSSLLWESIYEKRRPSYRHRVLYPILMRNDQELANAVYITREARFNVRKTRVEDFSIWLFLSVHIWIMLWCRKGTNTIIPAHNSTIKQYMSHWLLILKITYCRIPNMFDWFRSYHCPGASILCILCQVAVPLPLFFHWYRCLSVRLTSD